MGGILLEGDLFVRLLEAGLLQAQMLVEPACVGRQLMRCLGEEETVREKSAAKYVVFMMAYF